MLENKEFKSAEDDNDKIELVLSSEFSSLPRIGQDLFNVFVPYLSIVHVSFVEKKLRILITKKKEWLDVFYEILGIIHNLYETKTKQ